MARNSSRVTRFQCLAKSALLFTILVAVSSQAQSQELTARLKIPSGFDLSAAMRLLFGNFDAKTNSSSSTVPETAMLDLSDSFFEAGDDITVRPFWVSEASEDGQRKIVLLTYAIPTVDPAQAQAPPFDCHACAPLVGAAVFVASGSAWKVESKDIAVAFMGGFGRPPAEAKIVNIGPRRVGIEIDDSYAGQGVTVESKHLFVPWHDKVKDALSRVVSNDNEGTCGKDAGGIACYASSRKLLFVPGANPDYYDIELTLSGTDLPVANKPGLRHVHGFEKLSFVDGMYKTIQKSGDKLAEDR